MANRLGPGKPFLCFLFSPKAGTKLPREEVMRGWLKEARKALEEKRTREDNGYEGDAMAILTIEIYFGKGRFEGVQEENAGQENRPARQGTGGGVQKNLG